MSIKKNTFEVVVCQLKALFKNIRAITNIYICSKTVKYTVETVLE